MRGVKPDSRQRDLINRYGRNSDGKPYRGGDWLVLKETSEMFHLQHRFKKNFKIRLYKR